MDPDIYRTATIPEPPEPVAFPPKELPCPPPPPPVFTDPAVALVGGAGNAG